MQRQLNMKIGKLDCDSISMKMLVGRHQDDGYPSECDPGEKMQKKRKTSRLYFYILFPRLCQCLYYEVII